CGRLEQDALRTVDLNRVARRQLVRLLQKHERQPSLLVGRELADGELLVVGGEEAALAGIVREHLLLWRLVVEAQTLRRLDPDRARLALRGCEAGRRVDLSERRTVRVAVRVRAGGLRHQRRRLGWDACGSRRRRSGGRRLAAQSRRERQ